MRRFPFQRIHFKLPTFQTETCSGGINISILAACLSDKLSGQTNGLQGGPQTPIQDRSRSEDLPQSHNPLPLCKYSLIVQYCTNVPQPLPFIEKEKDVCISLNFDAHNYRHDIYFIRDSKQYFSFDRKVQKSLQIAVD